MMMDARGLVRLTIDGDDTSHTTHNLRDCFSVFTVHQVKVTSALFLVEAQFGVQTKCVHV